MRLLYVLAHLRLWNVARATRVRGLAMNLGAIRPDSFHCWLCQKSYPKTSSTRFVPCNHTFCQECARDYVQLRLAAKRLPVLCPQCMSDEARPKSMIGSK